MKLKLKNIFVLLTLCLVVAVSAAMILMYNDSSQAFEDEIRDSDRTYWDEVGIKADTPWVGTGALDDPFIIDSEARMGLMAHDIQEGETSCGINAREAHFRIVADLDMAAYYWPIVGGATILFTGKLSSESGYIISNLRQVADNNRGGLISQTGAGVRFYGLTLHNASIVATRNDIIQVGLLVGIHNSGLIEIENVTVSNSKISRDISGAVPNGTASSIGGLVGLSGVGTSISIKDVSIGDANNAGIEIDLSALPQGTNMVGGLIGRFQNNNSELEICGAIVNTDIIMGGIVGGGLVGEITATGTSAENTISNSVFYGSIMPSVAGVRIGGFVGALEGAGNNAFIDIVDSRMAGVISAANLGGWVEIGGFAGAIRGTGQNREFIARGIDRRTVMQGEIIAGGAASGVGGVLGRFGSHGANEASGASIMIESVDFTGTINRSGEGILPRGTGGVIGTIDRDNSNLIMRDIVVEGIVSSGGGATGGLVGYFGASQNNVQSGYVIIEDIEIINDAEILVTSGLAPGAANRPPIGGLMGVVESNGIDMTVNRVSVSSQALISGVRAGGLFGAIAASNSNIRIYDNIEVGGELRVRHELAGGIIGEFGSTSTVNSYLEINDAEVGISLVSRPSHNVQRIFGGIIGDIHSPLGAGTMNTITIGGDVFINSIMYFSPMPTGATPIRPLVINGRVIGRITGDLVHAVINGVSAGGMRAYDVANAAGNGGPQRQREVASDPNLRPNMPTLSMFNFSEATSPAGLLTSFVGYNDGGDNIVTVLLQAAAVIFNSKGGSAVMQIVRYCYIKPPDLLEIAGINLPSTEPTREHFVFLGWSRRDDIADIQHDPYDADAGREFVYYRFGTADDSVDVVWGESETIFAVWRAIPYVITFNDYHDATNNNRTWFTILCDGFDLNAIERTNYRFAGWWTTPQGEDGGVQISRIEDRTEDLTLYARWIIRTRIYRILYADGYFVVQEVESISNPSRVLYTVREQASFQDAFNAINNDAGGHNIVIIFG